MSLNLPKNLTIENEKILVSKNQSNMAKSIKDKAVRVNRTFDNSLDSIGTPKKKTLNTSDMEPYLRTLRARGLNMGIDQEKKRQKNIDILRLSKASELRKIKVSELDNTIHELEIEHQESMWETIKNRYEPSMMVKKMLKQMSQENEENQAKFIEDILLPDRL